MARSAHLVGSIPAPDTDAAMRTALDRLGPSLRTLPDGETGERYSWILHIVESLRSHPDLEVAKDGDWSDYDRLPRFRVRAGHRLFGATLDLSHVASAEQSWPVFQQVRAGAGRPDLTFQVGIPGDLDMALFTFGPQGALRQRRALAEATVAELRRIHELCGGDVVFQLEIPAELSALTRVPERGSPRRPACSPGDFSIWPRRRPRAPASDCTCASVTSGTARTRG